MASQYCLYQNKNTKSTPVTSRKMVTLRPKGSVNDKDFRERVWLFRIKWLFLHRKVRKSGAMSDNKGEK